MPTSDLNPQDSKAEHQRTTFRKLRRLALLMQVFSAAYAFWVLWSILNWWLDSETVIRLHGRFIGKDLSGMLDYQRYAALGLDLFAWSLLCVAVMQGWAFLQHLGQPVRWSDAVAKHISSCAWFGIACEVVTLLCRPIQGFILTVHLPATEQAWNWTYRSIDLLGVMFSLALLMIAYAFRWSMEVAEENRSFV